MSGEPIPKGSSIALDDAALLDKPSCLAYRCVVSGLPIDAKHHHPFRSRIPKAEQHRIPLFSVAGRGNTDLVHGLFHHHDLKPKWDERHGWYFVATDHGARMVNRWRAQSGVTWKVKAGIAFPALRWDDEYQPHDEYAPNLIAPPAETQVTHDAEITDQGDALHAIAAQIAEASGIESSMAYLQGTLLREARAIFAARFVGKRDAAQAYREWFTDSAHMSKSAVSKLESYAELPSEAADLGISRGYLVSKAVRDGITTVADGIAEARVLSVSDLRQRYWPREESEKVTIVCPLSGRECRSAAGVS